MLTDTIIKLYIIFYHIIVECIYCRT